MIIKKMSQNTLRENCKNLTFKCLNGLGELIDLSDSNTQKLIEFEKWFNPALESGSIELYFRGLDFKYFNKRVKDVKDAKNPQLALLNSLFARGDKAKVYLRDDFKRYLEGQLEKDEETIFDQPFIVLQETSEKAFTILFQELHNFSSGEEMAFGIKEKDKKKKEFIDKSPQLINFFKNENNQSEFIRKVLSFDELDRLRIRDYYVRILHSSNSFGKDNYRSHCISLTKRKPVAKDFGDILVYYWLPQPTERFGTSLEIISKLNPILIKNNLPVYHTDFYPSQQEFTATGCLFPGKVIGFKMDDYFVVNNKILWPGWKYDESFKEWGFEGDDEDSFDKGLEKETYYKAYVCLTGNLFYRDQHVSTTNKK